MKPSLNVRLFVGKIRPLPPENRPSGIFKSEVLVPTWLGREGLDGDTQADRRVHGGPDKALHQYPLGHYMRLAEAFPAAKEALLPGSIGENLSVAGWDESTMCIGDIFRLGDARIQVCQPRSPCWKIDRRYGTDGMTGLIAEEGITGWYFRILEEGSVEPGCVFELIDRLAPKTSIEFLLKTWRDHRPNPICLDGLSRTPGLVESWRKKLAERAARLKSLSE